MAGGRPIIPPPFFDMGEDQAGGADLLRSLSFYSFSRGPGAQNHASGSPSKYPTFADRLNIHVGLRSGPPEIAPPKTPILSESGYTMACGSTAVETHMYLSGLSDELISRCALPAPGGRVKQCPLRRGISLWPSRSRSQPSCASRA